MPDDEVGHNIAISVWDMVNLLEETVLLAYRDDNGRNNAPYLGMSLGGAALLELALSGHIGVDDSTKVAVLRQEPVGHPVLDDVLTRLSKSKAKHVVSSWVTILSGVDLRTPTLGGLVDQHILTHDRDRLLGFIPVNRYHPAEDDVETEVRARLERVFGHAVGVDARTAALVGVVSTTFMERAALPEHSYGEIQKVFTELADGHPVVKRVVDGIRLAVTIFRSGSGTASVAVTS